ncbi:MAG: EAL domain-containing protein [Hyphomonadaceae bacterium]|nr:EAL domain-containing protein [Hyphomonadaceae bacterium]
MGTDSISFARAELLNGMNTGAIRLAFQPQIDLKTQQIVGFEGVARWFHPKLGTLTPGLFLGLAAREGLLDTLSRALVKDAALAVCSWRARGHRVDLGINLSSRDLVDPNFGADILALVRASGALPHWIVLEANEESVAFIGEPALRGLEMLKGLGFKIALDARGPATIALDKRARALFCQLKCGGTTMLSVASRLHSVGASAFMQRLDAARGAGFPIVAVGAESQEALQLCCELGFTRLQGKVIAMPVSVEKCLYFLEQVGVPEFVEETAHPIMQDESSPAAPPPPEPVARSVGFTMFSLDYASNDDETLEQAA